MAPLSLSSAVLVVAGLLLASFPGTRQQEPQPTFRSRVELLRLPVTVVDGNGQPVRDLVPSDFSVKVDGRERKLLFASFIGPAAAGTAADRMKPAALAPTYALNTASVAGRVVVFVVDLIGIKQGYEKSILDRAAGLVDALGPNDAVGLMPVPGKSVDVTRDRAQVSEALRLLRGMTNVPFITHYFTVSEAVAFEQSNSRVMTEAIERECCQTCRTCPSEMRAETSELLRFARYHVQSVLTSLTRLATTLQRVEAPKTIVLLSAGLPFEQESLSLFLDLQRALTQAGITIYAVQVSQPDSDASNLRRPGVGIYQASDMTTGLANVATMAGGAMFMGVGTASGVFERLRAEIVHAYELGVEGSPTDNDRKTHDVEVKVSRPGVTVRSRLKLLLPDDIADPSKRLGNLLGQPVDRADLPVAVTAFSVRGDETATLKLIIAAELAHGTRISSPLRYGLAILQGNKVVFENAGTVAQGTEGAPVVIATQLAPGQYRLRVAAIDGSGRAGTVELPISVGLGTAASLQFSDVIVGVTGQSFTPAIRVRADQPLDALVELYSEEPAQFATASVSFEFRKGDEPARIADHPAALRATSSERRRVAEGRVSTTGLPPGDYRVSAVVSVGGKAVGTVSRTILIEP